MKTLPVIITDLGKSNRENALLREYMRQDRAKMNRVVLIDIPKEEPQIPDFIKEKDNIDFSEKIKQFNKEIFGK